VQVHDIPYKYMTKHMAECLCDIIGEVKKSSGAVDDDGGQFLRVRVTLYLNLPLCRGRVITLEGGAKSWVSFKYKRLPNLCYWCGRLSHDDKNCDLWINSKGTLKAENQQFWSCLRAAPYTSASKDVIYVPGYCEDRYSRQNKLSQALVVESVVEEGVNSEAPMEQPDKEKAQQERIINAVSVSISNSPAGMEGVMHDEPQKSIPSISEAISQLDLVIPTDQNPSNVRDVYLDTLKEIDTEIFKFDSPGHISVMGASQCSHTVRGAPSLTPQARDSLKHLVSIQFQNSTLTDVPILIDISVPHPSTWKRIPRPSHEAAFSQPTHSSSKRPFSLLHDSNELPCKRRLISQVESGSTILLAKTDIQSYQEP